MGKKTQNRAQNNEKYRPELQFLIKGWRKMADISVVTLYTFSLTTHLQENHDGNSSGRKKIGENIG
jgi:hypothetical protein